MNEVDEDPPQIWIRLREKFERRSEAEAEASFMLFLDFAHLESETSSEMIERYETTLQNCRTLEEIDDVTKIRDEEAAVAEEAVPDVAAVTARAEVTVMGVRKFQVETTGARSLATVAARRATSSPSAQRRARNVANVGRWVICNPCASPRPMAVLLVDHEPRKQSSSMTTTASLAL